MANGFGKAEAVRKGMEEAPDNNIALSLLQDCSNCDLVIDMQAAASLTNTRAELVGSKSIILKIGQTTKTRDARSIINSAA
jgi:hypothetical protein